MRVKNLPVLELKDGTLEFLKWLALALMIGDHINKYLLNDTVTWMFDAGRAAMPLFVFVLAYNLARPAASERGVYGRTLARLLIFGALATPAFIALGGLGGGWWPLNILFTLAALTGILACLEQKSQRSHLAAIFLFVVAGSLVEFWWPAIAFGIAVWSYKRQPSIATAALAFVALASLHQINGNSWAMVAIVPIMLSRLVDIKIPRVRWFFYAFYPAHLSLIWLARIPLREAGYLFFT